MDRIEVVVGDVSTMKFERRFEGVTVDRFPVWFNVVHDGADESSPVTNIGGQYSNAAGRTDILLARKDDGWLDLVTGITIAAETAAPWQEALPWMVADGAWREIRRCLVVPRQSEQMHWTVIQ